MFNNSSMLGFAYKKMQESCILQSLRSVFAGEITKPEAIEFLSNTDKDMDLEKIAQRLKEIKILMAGIDSRSIRPMRAILTDTATKQDKKNLLSLERVAKELRVEAANLAMLQVELMSKQNVQ